MVRGGVFSRPVLRFGSGTSIFPYEGFKLGFGPFSGPDAVRLCFICPRGMYSYSRVLMDNLIYGVRGFGGLTGWFGCRVGDVEYFFESYDRYADVIDSIEDVDVAIVAVPDENYPGFEEDPYVPIKQALALRGIPSQMVTYSTIRRLAGKSYVLFNLALSIYCKAGGIPWVLGDRLLGDAYIGLDTVGNNVVVTVFVFDGGIFFDWRFEFNPGVEVIYSIRNVLTLALDVIHRHAGRVNLIVVHRDGSTFDVELEAVRDVMDSAVDEGVASNWVFVEVKKRAVPRVTRRVGRRVTNPEKGTFYVLDKYRYLVVTSGFPEHPYIDVSGLVRPVVVELAEASNWEVSMYDIARDVYWLSELHWASAFASTRLPITTLYAHRICSFLRLGVSPSEEYYSRLWFL